MKVKIYITLKEGIHDPQGQAVQQSLQTLGFEMVQNVRMGKLVEVDLKDMTNDAAEAIIKSMCKKLLANVVIEDFRYEIVST